MPRTREQIRISLHDNAKRCQVFNQRVNDSKSDYYKGESGLNRACTDFLTYCCALSELKSLLYDAKACSWLDLASQIEMFIIVLDADLDRVKAIKDKLMEEIPPKNFV